MSEHKADNGIQKLPTTLSILIMELYIRKSFSFLPVSFLFAIYMKKRKVFLMCNSMMRIESMVGSF